MPASWTARNSSRRSIIDMPDDEVGCGAGSWAIFLLSDDDEVPVCRLLEEEDICNDEDDEDVTISA